MTSKDNACRSLHRAFRDLILNLIGLFDVYEADPALVASTADVIAKVYRAHLLLQPKPRHKRAHRKSALAALGTLLAEINAANRNA